MDDALGSLGPLLACIVGFCAIPTFAYFVYERRYRSAWGTVPGPSVRVAHGAYRATEVEGAPVAARAPRVVRVAAWASLALGQMFVPGLFLGLVGLFAWGIGLMALPGLIVAAQTFALGKALLSRAPDAATRARKAAGYTFVLNGAILVVMAVLALFALRVSEPTLLVLDSVISVYALISIGHGCLLSAAAAALTTDRAAPDSPPRFEPYSVTS